ncbi:MAG: ribulose-phosphate 3-epimerase [Verrucomicrobia bacterium]|nr:ribulose-phosphate 3-epimerase [Verrucomicrobiota bacterium]
MNLKLPVVVAPSILASDFGHLADEALRAVDAGADRLHLDVMDGHFVRNLTMGPAAVAAINRATDVYLDVHLMIYSPFDYIERFVEAGADSITIHFEATENISETLDYIRKCNVKAGLAFCPETSVEFIPKYLHQCDLILLMTVDPGFGGQQFISEVLDKIEFTRHLCNTLHLEGLDIQVDGGINQETAALAYEAGANVFVAGTYLFSDNQMAEKIARMKSLAGKRSRD